MNATLHDVATRSGVSLRTVYNVLSGKVHVSAETESHVRQAMEDLGYRPHMLAQGLRNGKTQILAMMVPELDVPYFSELVRIVIHEARARGYVVMVDQTDGEIVREREMVRDLAQTRLFDGILVSSLGLAPRDVSQLDIPIVLLGEHLVGGIHDHVSIDNVAAARDATDHLLELGRTKVAAIGHQTANTAALRTQGFIQAHDDHHLIVDDDFIVKTTKFHFDEGASAVESLWHTGKRPDALFCYNDLLALGAMKQLDRMGLSVPEDVAVVGFDNIQAAEYAIPGLTTISPQKAQLAAAAVTVLIDRISGERSGPGEEILVDYDLVVRGSTSGAD